MFVLVIEGLDRIKDSHELYSRCSSSLSVTKKMMQYRCKQRFLKVAKVSRGSQLFRDVQAYLTQPDY